jgi:DNA-binding NarL/FixJ family response regulator
MPRTRVLLADDHTLVAEALRTLLEPQSEVIGIVADGNAVITTAKDTKPDVIVLDINMPLLNGLDATEQLHKLLPKTKIIILTMDENHVVAAEALRRGASGYLLKTSAASELPKALQDVMRSKSYLTPNIAQKMMEAWVRDPRQHGAKKLTQRQRDVLQLLAQGHTMKEIAARLGITSRTVAFHKYRIMEEFGLKNNADLFQLALREHLTGDNLQST